MGADKQAENTLERNRLDRVQQAISPPKSS
jgi:hypothetical protein